MPDRHRHHSNLEAECAELRLQLNEAIETLESIRTGAVDALVVSGPEGNRIYSLEGALEPYRALIEEMQEGALTLSKSGRIHYCNRHFAEIVEQSLDAIIGSDFWSLLADGEQAAFRRMLEATPPRPVTRDMHLCAAKNGDRPVRVALSQIHGTRQDVVLAVVTDLREQLRRESELSAAATELEHRVQEQSRLNRRLEEARVAALNMMKDAVEARRALEQLNGQLEQRVAERTQELSWRMSELQTIFETVPVGLALAYNTEGRQIWGNPALERLTGVARGSEISLSAESRPPYRACDLSGVELALNDLPMQRACRGEVVMGSIMRIERADGGACILHSNATPLRDEAGNLRGAVGAFLDITELKRSEEALRASEERFKVIAASTPDHLLVQDRDLRYELVVNPRLDLTVEEMIGKTDYDILAKADAEKLTAMKRQVLETGEALQVALQLPAKSGGIRFFEGSYVPRRDADGRVNGIIGYFRDVTERHRIDEQIRNLNAQLQDRAAELEATNKELETFSYSVSHDLRAPLRSIDGFSRILLRDFGEALGDRGRDDLERIRAATQRMAALIDDLLHLSRVVRAEFHRAPIDLSQLATAIAGELAATAPERQVEWQIAPDLHASADPVLIRAVLENLLGNAWKFTQHQPAAYIEFSAIHGESERVFVVRDNGAGFDMQYADKLFGPFQRLHSVADFPGTGVGLATVQRIIHRHGGKVWAEGQVGRGATFYFTLPDNAAKT